MQGCSLVKVSYIDRLLALSKTASFSFAVPVYKMIDYG